LFTAVLSHTAAFQHPTFQQDNEKPIVLLPPFDLPLDSNGKLTLPPPASWLRARQQIHSSLPFYSADDQPLFDASQPLLTIWQDMLAQQPYYRALLRLFIAARFSNYGSNPIMLQTADDWGEMVVQIGEQQRGLLSDLLPGLVSLLGCHPLALVTSDTIRRILGHWQKVAVIGVENGRLVLTETYARTLHERHRAQMLLRGLARAEQTRVEAFLLKERL
jgi:hypothetical protein